MPSRGLPVRHSQQMSTTLVTTRATTATRAVCVRYGVGRKTAFSAVLPDLLFFRHIWLVLIGLAGKIRI